MVGVNLRILKKKTVLSFMLLIMKKKKVCVKNIGEKQ